MHRYNVHFQISPDVEISVTVESDNIDESEAVIKARRRLSDMGLKQFSESKYIIDILE